MIRLDPTTPIGPILRRLRHDAGLTLAQLATQTHVTRSAIIKRETRSCPPAVALVEHLDILGYDLVIVRKPRENA